MVLLGLGLPLAGAGLLLPPPPGSISGPFEHRIPHPVLGWSLEPGVRYVNHTSSGDVVVSYNSDGWRDLEYASMRSTDHPRIVVLGDSYMEAYTVSLDDAFHRRLAASLATDPTRPTTINLGVGGYGTLQELLAFRAAGLAFEPDLVVLGFYPNNDVVNNSAALETTLRGRRMKALARPFLDAAPETWRISRVDYEGAVARYERERRRRTGFWRRLMDRSAIAHTGMLAWERFSNALIADRDTGTDEASPRQERRLRIRYGVELCKEPAEFTEAWAITRRILDRLRSEVEAAGARLLVMNVPAVNEVDIAAGKADLTALVHTGELCPEAAPGHARLSAMLVELGIEFIDLLRPFRAAWRRDGTALFDAKDRHWNAAGHRLAAEVVAKEISARRLLSPLGEPSASNRRPPASAPTETSTDRSSGGV